MIKGRIQERGRKRKKKSPKSNQKPSQCMYMARRKNKTRQDKTVQQPKEREEAPNYRR
jgi:hypothetical protein